MNILVIGDTHCPFEKKHYLEFCVQTKKKYKCKEIFHIGDVADFHAISDYRHDPDGFSPFNELKVTVEVLQGWYKAFPDVKVCWGNHDERLSRTALKYGLSGTYFKSIEEILEFPKGWQYQLDYFVFGIRIFHGMGYGGKYAHITAAVENQQSIVMGHLHTLGGCEYIANNNRLIFGLATGCGIDHKSYAFNYGRDNRRKPILGCGVILEDGKQGHFEPMDT